MVSRKAIPIALRQFVRERAGRCCEYCHSQEGFTTETFEVEHIHPISLGGLTEIYNVAYACSGCNGRKAKRIVATDPETGLLTSLFHPRSQRWNEHFVWTDDKTRLTGLTATGRATIVALALNRQALVNLRRVLRMAGEHPPVILES